MPHRNVIGMSAEATIESTALVDEYLLDGMAANAKYLNEEGESAVLAVTGKVSSITTDQINQKVILLKGADTLEHSLQDTYESDASSDCTVRIP